MLARFVVLVGYVSLGVGGCLVQDAVQEAPSDEPVLRMAPSSSQLGISGELVSGTERVLFQTEVLPQHDDELRPEGGADVELAVRFTDSDGHNIAVRTEGAELPTGWDVATTERFLVAEVAAAGEALSRRDVPEGLQPHVDALVELAFAFESAQADAGEDDDRGGAVPYTTTWYKKISLWKKDFPGYGEHSATRTKTMRNGVMYAIDDRCNHGTCPKSGPMEKRFTCYGPTVTNLSVLASPGECSTSYNVVSTPWGHNCNDDSWLQLRRVALNWPTLLDDAGDCSNSKMHSFAPKCCPINGYDTSCRGAN